MSTVITSILIWTYLSKSWRILPKYRVGTPISSPSWSKQWSLEGCRTKSSENLTESDLAISDWMECGAARTTTTIKVSHLHTMLQIQPQEWSHHTVTFLTFSAFGLCENSFPYSPILVKQTFLNVNFSAKIQCPWIQNFSSSHILKKSQNTLYWDLAFPLLGNKEGRLYWGLGEVNFIFWNERFWI